MTSFLIAVLQFLIGFFTGGASMFLVSATIGSAAMVLSCLVHLPVYRGIAVRSLGLSVAIFLFFAFLSYWDWKLVSWLLEKGDWDWRDWAVTGMIAGAVVPGIPALSMIPGLWAASIQGMEQSFKKENNLG